MSKVIDLRAISRELRMGGEPPDNRDMEARVAKLESLAEKTNERLAGIDVRLATIEAKMDKFATGGDLHKAINDQTWKIIGAVVTLGTLLSAIVFFIARNVR